ncbi:MAG: DUF4178 domain-containing protein [Pseudomonadota bacterium]|nr:DUF4178 domain-containing protein [Pseudomonadota bacterium]
MGVNSLVFSAACPSCGAPVPFRSAASVMAVCEYCQTTVLRDADSVRDQGKMSAVLEDYSPLQIGSSGVLNGLAFSLIGRLQLKYSDGMWNEWYLIFDDGSNGWLSDASGQYTLTRPVGEVLTAPTFEELSVNKPIFYKGRDYRVTDVRTADCVGGQGELPFAVGDGWQAKVADLRKDQQFLTLDYTEGLHPQGFEGDAYRLQDLQMQMLRDTDQMVATAGQVRGQMTSLSCPNCGSPVPYVAGVAEHLICPACRAEVAVTGDTATVLQTHKRLLSVNTLLELGDKAVIAHQHYAVLGIAQMNEVGEPTLWIEYLLYSTEAGFLWLVDEGHGKWSQVHVLNELPEQKNGAVFWQGKRWSPEWIYKSQVKYAIGAFNWRMKIGDVTELQSFKHGKQTLTAEKTTSEMNWSWAEPLSEATVRQWFGKPSMPTGSTALDPEGHVDQHQKIFKWSAIILWVVNLPLVMFGSGSFGLLIVATVILFVISLMVRR